MALTAPGPCTPAETRSTAIEFVRAWNAGDIARADGIVAPEPVFKWFSSGRPGARFGASAYDRWSFRRYVLRRHAKHDRMRIVRFRFNGSDVRDDGGYGHFEYDIVRSADDYAHGTPFRATGKGAVNCSLPRTAIAVWSMAGAE